MDTSIPRVLEETCLDGDHAGSRKMYHHAPLGKDEVRVLRILDASHKTIRCTLEHISRDRLGFDYKYYALSYCWGTGEADTEIEIDGSVFFITANLFCALQAARRYMKYSAQSANAIWAINVIWVDAISLDQSNIEEKSSQVQRMHEIYRDASEVLVWLGEEADSSQWAMMLLQWLADSFFPLSGYHCLGRGRRPIHTQLESRLLRHYGIRRDVLLALKEAVSRFSWLESRRAFNSKNLEGFLNSCLPAEQALLLVYSDLGLDHELWDACDKLMTRPWFYRVWTYQEITISRQASVLCGEEHIDWEAVRLWRNQCFPIYTHHILPGWISAPLLRTEYPMQGNWNRHWQGRTRTLQSALGQVDGRRARDDRDYVFGLLGLLDAETRSKFAVDYSLAPSKIFTAAVSLACSLPGGIDFWCHLVEVYAGAAQTHTTNYPDLPSWCPDLSYRAQPAPNLPYVASTPFQRRLQNVMAAKKSIVVGERGDLHITGVVLDEVEASATLAPCDLAQKRAVDEENILRHVFSRHHERWLDEMQQVPVSDQKRVFDLLRDVHRRILSQGTDNMTAAYESLELPDTVQDSIEDDLAIFGVNNGRYFFRSKAGRIGFSPRPTKPGDRICFIGGGGYFHVLSADLTTWVTIASLDGLRDDTILPIVQSQPWQTFNLK
ncbi:hypothetical protein LTR56_007356 [Elasticomyces elasticus]|nr:hypothetical protein LTR56_007356 [Elasticomyces elasticus]KAK3668101.1 hypothetical protein LTR22_001172 [Elasticomyces elasticus]KAK4925249.1 hypothetical protein LTR49_007790 [Elasticomyces elasticus]